MLLVAVPIGHWPIHAADDTLAAYAAGALVKAGDPERGRQLFFDERLKCAVCHRVAGRGGSTGPDLTHVGAKLDRPHLVESLLEPSRQVLQGYETRIVETHDGRVLQGIVREESPAGLLMVDAEGREHRVAAGDIAQVRTSDVSLMPAGWQQLMTQSEFVDLVAFLESLGGGRNTPGSAVSGPLHMPPGIAARTVATGLTGAVALEVTPDRRVLICEQTGTLRVVQHDQLLPEPAIRLEVDSYWERGLIGVTVDPQFPARPLVYLCYVKARPFPHHVVSRFTMHGNRLLADSEQVLLEGDDQRQYAGQVPAGHQGGALHFGPDGALYIAIGEHTAGQPAQQLDSFLGKILRINPDGSIPKDNPFFETLSGKYRAIWAYGFRNPFTFAFDRTGRWMLINDVGGAQEEINQGEPGANYGWPRVDHGRPPPDGIRGALYSYPQASVAGGDFVPADSPWPRDWWGKYLFGDFVLGKLFLLDPNSRQVTELVSGLRRPVDLRFAGDGSLYVLQRNAWVIDNHFQPATGSLLKLTWAGP
ncbi:MAG: hypothetical protein KatS3mg110_3932 [Pirellulaceae bacterium]|nr:MAG: hypothetical protein KatS3mg110_3932 [Pirellulaceae bacterium]